MKYVILRRQLGLEEHPFEVIVGARDQSEVPLAFRIEAEDLSDQDLGELRRDPSVIDLIPSIPLSLIEPFDEPVTEETSARDARGVEAVGATASAQPGAGVTVAVLDSGIDISHPAFAGVEFHPEDLIDFTGDERGTIGAAPDMHGHGS